MFSTAKSLVDKVSPLYSLPVVYTQLDTAINDPCSNLEDIANIISSDAALSARLLKLANSALYGLPSQIETITRAITVIGTRQLRDLAFATFVINIFKGIPNDIVNMDSFWRHSIATGTCARVIATYQRQPNVERFYLMGLLHDIGRLIMFIQIPETMSQLIQHCKTNNILLFQHEKKELGFDHMEVGKYLLESWSIPDSIVQAVGNHHHPIYSGEFKNEIAVIHFADILINALQLGSSGESFVPPFEDKIWQLLQLQSSQIPDILKHTELQYETVVDIFLS